MVRWLAAVWLVAGAVLLPGCDQTTKLRIRTEPPGAQLYWNTQTLGASPCLITLPPEQKGFPEVHVFEARKSGYEPAYHYLNARPKNSLSGKAEITIRLTRLPEGVWDADVPEALPYVPYNKRAKD